MENESFGARLSFTDEINNEILPKALMMGVDYDLFWTLNPESLKPFIKAFSLQQEQIDTSAWLNGLYVRLAVGSVLGNNTDYPKQPLSIAKEPSEEELVNEIKNAVIERMVIINSRFKE